MIKSEIINMFTRKTIKIIIRGINTPLNYKNHKKKLDAEISFETLYQQTELVKGYHFF